MVRKGTLNNSPRNQQNRGDLNGIKRVEGVVFFSLPLAGTMEDQFLFLPRHYPYQMAETSLVCRSHLESIYTCLLDIFEEGIQKGIQDGSVAVAAPRKTAMVLFAMVDGIVRLNTYRVYDAGALFESLTVACRRLLTGGR